MGCVPTICRQRRRGRPVQNDRYIKESATNTVCGTLFYHFIIFRQDLASSSSVEQGAIWHREAMVRMLAI